MSHIQLLLQKFGLTLKEIALYLATLELGSASVQKIAMKSGVIRSTAYEVLEVLRAKGLVSTFLKKRTRYYSAEDPSHLVQWAEGKVEALKDALPELTALAGRSRHRPSLRFYEGKDGVKSILGEILEEAKELIGFASVDDVFREIDQFEDFVRERVKRRIPIRVILRASPKAEERKQLGPEQLREVKIVPSHHVYHGLLYVWNNKVALFSFTYDYVIIVMESSEIAALERALFENLWEALLV